MKFIFSLLAGFFITVLLGYFVLIDEKALPILTLSILISAVPAFCWKKTRRLAPSIVGLLFLHSLFLKVFINGEASLCHDSFTATKFTSLLQEWKTEGFVLGWNPYLGAGQPVYLFTNFIHYFAAESFIHIINFFDMKISGNQLSNLVFISSHYFTSVGLALLLRLLVANPILVLFGMSSFLFGGLFYNNIFQHYATQIVDPVVYSLFFLIHFLKYKRMASLFLFFLFFGGFANNYIPVYVGVPLTLFFISWCIAQPQNIAPIKQWLREKREEVRSFSIFSKVPQIILCCMVFLLTAGPLVFLSLEMSDFNSPTRGNSNRGKISSKGYGFQGSVNAPITGYQILYEKKGDPGRGGHHGHHTSYIGIPAFLFVSLPFLVMFQKRRPGGAAANYREFWARVFSLATLGLMLLGAGKDSSFWSLYVEYFPFGAIIRHSAGFAAISTVFFIVLSVCGFNLFFNRHISFYLKSASLLFGMVFIMFAELRQIDSWIAIASGAGLLIVLFADLKAERWHSIRNIIPALFLLVLAIDLGVYTFKHTSLGFCMLREEPRQEFAYPKTWKSECNPCNDPIPFNLQSIPDKEIIWSHPKDDFMFLLQRKFGNFLVDTVRPIGQLQGELFYVMENLEDWNPDEIKTKPGPDSLSIVQLPGVGIVESVESDSPNRLSVVLTADKKAWLLRMENFHYGWKAFIDGVEAKIERVEPNFQVIPVPKGRSRVEFVFETNYPKIRNGSLCMIGLGWILMLIYLKNENRINGFWPIRQCEEKRCIWILNGVLSLSLIYLWLI